MDEYDLYLQGFFFARLDRVEHGLTEMFGLHPRKAHEFVRSLPRIVKRRIPASERARYAQALDAIGGDYEFRPSPIRPAPTLLIQGEDIDDPLIDHEPGITLPPPRLDSLPHAAAGAAPGARGWGETLVLAPGARAENPLEPRAPEPAPPRREPNAPEPGPLPEHAAERTPRAQPTLGELPPAWQVPGLQLDGRPDWLVEGPASFEAALSENQPAPLEIASVRPARGREARASPPRSDAPRAVGTVLGRELPPEMPLALRWSLRAGIGLSLFVLITLARQYGAVDRGMEHALARFSGADQGQQPEGGSGAGPLAAAWLESELHQVGNGDKDRVRALVERFNHAGAVAVRVNQIHQSGPLQIANELLVTLPSNDPDARRAVLDVQRRFLESIFGGAVADVSDPKDDLLHVAL